MCLPIVLPKVNPEAITVPSQCVYVGCGGRKLQLRQEVTKPLRDTVYQEVQVPENAVRVSRLLAWCGNFLNSEDGAMLAGLLQ